MKLLLVGNPNAGKSTLFNKLTRAHARVGNWHGVTVGVLEKTVRLGEQTVSVCDLPGIYSLDAMSLEEKLAVSYLKKEREAPVLFVAECASLDRSLPLMQAIAKERRVILVLTKRGRFLREGGFLDSEKLQARTGVPVLDGDLSRRELIKELERLLFSFRPVEGIRGGLTEEVYRLPRAGFSRADQLLTSGWFAYPFFFLLLLAAFFLTFFPGLLGDLMKRGLERFFTEVLGGAAQRIPSPVLRSFVCDGLLHSVGGVLGFLPQIALLYLFLILLEESGLLSRLAALTDGAFSKFGLNGRAMFSLLMGFGCSAAAIASTRGLNDKRMQRRVILCLPYISCSAKLPVYLALSASFFANPFVAVVLLYLLGVCLAFLVALFLRERERGVFLLELAPLQIPKPAFVAKSLLFQIKQFIIKVSTVILAFFLLSWFLSSFDFSLRFCGAEESILKTLCGGFRFLFAPVGMNDWRIAYAALSGLIAKENVAGALALFYGGAFPFGAKSAFAFAVFMLATSPCVSAIAATARETGKKRALLYALSESVTALLLSYAVYFALSYPTACIFLLPALLSFLLVGKLTFENVRSNRKNHVKSLHRQRLGAGVLPLEHSFERGKSARQRQKGEKRLPALRWGPGRVLPDGEGGNNARLLRSVRGRKGPRRR